VGALPTSATAAPGLIAQGRSGETVVEFAVTIAQTGATGEYFSADGCLTRIAGFDGPMFAGEPATPANALFPATAIAQLKGRMVQAAIHVIDLEGVLTVRSRNSPTDPGTVIGEFAVVLQDVLTVFAPNQGLPVLDGEVVQTAAMPFGATGGPFGRKGQRLRLRATGLGTRTDPATNNSTLDVAGSWTAV
jgi:hypothetical protein